MKIIGIRRNAVIDFYDNKKGQQVHLEGTYLYLADTAQDVEGVKFEKPTFISNTKPCFNNLKDVKVGDEVTVYYNRFGSVDAVVPVQK